MADMTGERTAWRILDIMRRLGVSRTTVERLIRDDPEFPAPVSITPRLRRWDSEAVEQWLRRRQKTGGGAA